MRRLILYFLILCPTIVFGQLFPKADDFKGNIRSIVEKRYGREGKYLLVFKEAFRPTVYSGLKYNYEFARNQASIQRINTFRGKFIANHVYQRDSTANRVTFRETLAENENGPVGDYSEYENIYSPDGKIEKVNYWIYDASNGVRKLFEVEQDAEYDQGKLTSFTSRQMDENGNVFSEEKCKLFYSSNGRLSRIDRIDQQSGYTTTISYSYDGQGFVSYFSVDFLVELQEYGKTQVQYVYFTNDKYGNWTKTYQIIDGEIMNLAKRSISYY